MPQDSFARPHRRYVARNRKSNVDVNWLGSAESKEAMQKRLREYEAPAYVESEERVDLELSQFGQFSGGSENLYKDPTFGTLETEGVKYVADNGYGWFVSDAKVLVKSPRLRNEEFVVVRLKVNPDKTATVTYDDGNDHVLYHQNYKWTDAKRDVKLYYENGVLMLPEER